MPQVTLYLDDETARLMREQAKAEGVPYSRWVARLIRSRVGTTWPAGVVADLGAHADMPLADALRSTDAPDRPPLPW